MPGEPAQETSGRPSLGSNDLAANNLRRRWYFGLLLCLVVGSAYSRVLQCQFVNWDDSSNIYLNPSYHPVTMSGIADFWRRPQLGMYIPVTRTVWAGLVRLAHLSQPIAMVGVGSIDLDPRVFHAFSLLLHLLNVLLVFAILRRVVVDDVAALAGASLFGLHPLQVESVAWIAESKGLLCAFWSLLALLLVQAYLGVPTGSVRRRAAAAASFAICATVCLVLALLCKPSAVVLPVLAVVLVWLARKRLPDVAATRSRQVLALAGCWCLLVGLLIVETHNLQPVPISASTPLLLRPLVAGDALAFYLEKLVVPLRLSADYGRTPQWVANHGYLWWTWLLPAALASIVLKWRRPCLVAAASIFVVALLPVLGLVPFIYQTFSTVADRYAYLAMLGPSLSLGCVLARHQGRPALAAAACWLLLLGLLSYRQVEVWTDSETLFTHALSVNPDSWSAHNNLGLAYQTEGRLPEAVVQYRATMGLKPDFPEAPYNYALVLLAQGEPEPAKLLLNRAIAIDPLYAEPELQLGLLLARRGDAPGAVQHLRRAVALDPDDWQCCVALGQLLREQGKIEEAGGYLQRAVQLNPSAAGARYQFGLALNQLNYALAAQEQFVAALRLEPNYPDALAALGALLARQGKLQEAHALLERAVALEPNLVLARYFLGGVFLVQGNKAAAAAQWRAALKVQPGYAPAAKALASIGTR